MNLVTIQNVYRLVAPKEQKKFEKNKKKKTFSFKTFVMCLGL